MPDAPADHRDIAEDARLATEAREREVKRAKAENLLEVTQPVDALLHARRRRPRRRRRQLRARLRRDARAGRRVGLRQERHGAVDHAAGAGPAGQDRVRRDPVRGRRPAQARRRRDAPAARQGHRVHLPGPADQPQPDADDRLPDRRVDPPAHGPAREGGQGSRRRAARQGRHPATQGPAERTTRTSSRAACASA